MPSASEQEAAAHAKWYAHMRAHFAKVDAFELVVESPPAADTRGPVSPSLTTSAAPRTLLYPAEPGAATHGSVHDEQPQHSPAQEDVAEQAQEDKGSKEAQTQIATPARSPGLHAALQQLRDDTLTPQTRRSNASEAPRPSVLHRLSNRLSLSNTLSRLSLGKEASTPGSQVPEDAGVPETSHKLASRRSSARGSGAMMSERLSRHAFERRGTLLPDGGVSPIAESPAEAASTPEPDESSPQRQADDSAAADLASDLEARLQISPDASVDQLQGTDLQADEAAVEIRDVAPTTALEGLLHLAGQQAESDSLPTMDKLLSRFDGMQSVRKLGEGTFGEAYGTAEGRVFKVLPLDGEQLVNGEVQKTAGEILAEAAITLALSKLREAGAPTARSANATSGFVELFGLGLCRGAYSTVLTREWHAWDRAHGSENDPIDHFGGDQLFMVYVTADGGVDLEHVQVHSYEEAVSILLQVALILAVAEEACEFEHRDLHWGNLLIKRTSVHTHMYRLRGVDVKVVSNGVEVTLIDFTLSRLRTGKGQDVQFCNLNDDPALFQGPKGDCQADTYRRMKAKTRGHWEGFHPVTNTLWMHYLADIMLSCKKPPCSSEQLRALRGFRKRALGCKSSGEVLWDELFQGQWLALPPKKHTWESLAAEALPAHHPWRSAPGSDVKGYVESLARAKHTLPPPTRIGLWSGTYDAFNSAVNHQGTHIIVREFDTISVKRLSLKDTSNSLHTIFTVTPETVMIDKESEGSSAQSWNG
ncbi:hypothetical protein WJX73_003144 [Symbiochloris irregularis]|uniref:non-specific serine/threonine protein kinase n=1 Tax=Symbiochloris irregularis TaxID=706552 RepID=A0AAW1NWR2_9CHLO